MQITIEEIRSNKVLALSWKEPYGSLMLHGKIETRTWKTNYRGLVLICCSKKSYNCGQVINISGEKQYARIVETLGTNYNQTQTEGNAIAIGRLVFCRMMQACDENVTFVSSGGFLCCHVYEDVTPIEPFPWKGKQGWSTVSDEVKNKIILKN